MEQNEKFVLPLSAWQTHSPASDEINAAYAEEIRVYQGSPAAPCTKATSLKLLKRCARKDFHDFWTSPIGEYLPAVSEGTMKLCETVYSHDEAIRYAKELISTLSPKELAKDFLYGVAHNVPEYRTALACYYYIKNLPEHQFEKKFLQLIQCIKSINWCQVCNIKLFQLIDNIFILNCIKEAHLS